MIHLPGEHGIEVDAQTEPNSLQMRQIDAVQQKSMHDSILLLKIIANLMKLTSEIKSKGCKNRIEISIKNFKQIQEKEIH